MALQGCVPDVLLAWAALVGLFGVVAALVFGLLGVPQLANVLGVPAGLMFSTVFYISLLFTFDDSFGDVAERAGRAGGVVTAPRAATIVALVIGCGLGGCAVVNLAAATAGAAISVSRRRRQHRRRVTGKVIEQTIDLVSSAPD